MSGPLWAPSEEAAAAANITAFMRRAERAWGLALPDYASLYAWSVGKPEQFWGSLWDFVEIIGEKGDGPVIENPQDMREARFFPNARLNFAENLLRQRDDSGAVIFWCEDRERRKVTHRQLYDMVSRISRAFKAAGLREGDRVGAVLPNIPETLACMLAVNSLGGIWSSCSPDFGVRGVIDRLGQIEPRFLLGVNGYFYNGKPHDTRAHLDEIRGQLPDVQDTIVLQFPGFEEVGGGPSGVTAFADFIAPFEPGDIEFLRGPFDQPAFILYTSGTTGVPKCILHGAGRVLLQLCKEQWLHFDVKPGEPFYYFTTAGWNMWYTLVTALAAGGIAVMYEGSPFHPKPDVIFDLIDETKMAVFGTAPKYIDRIKKLGLKPCDTHDLSSLKAILSTGSPLAPDSFDYVYGNIKSDVRLSSISGGTEIMTTFANGNPIGPVWRGELQARTLGMRVEVYNELAEPLRGEKGELVCTAPFPSRPLRLLNDPGGRRYHETYFSRFPNVWCHGDFAELTEHGGLIIYGRSDATLNPGGIRIGTAEIYRPVEQFEEVADSLVVGQDWEGDQRLVLFVKLQDGITLDQDLEERIKSRIREHATPRHVPAEVIQVTDIPYTMNGKKVELAVKNILHGMPVQNVGSIANPEALDSFKSFAETRD